MKPFTFRIATYVLLFFCLISFLEGLNYAVMVPIKEGFLHIIDKLLILCLSIYGVYYGKKGGNFEKRWSEKNQG